MKMFEAICNSCDHCKFTLDGKQYPCPFSEGNLCNPDQYSDSDIIDLYNVIIVHGQYKGGFLHGIKQTF